MNKFSWYDAKTVDEALRQADTTVSAALTRDPGVATIIKSGGTDVLDFIKEGLVVPARVVNIRNIKDLNGITYDPKKGLRIGANATLSEMEGHADIKANYLAIHQATAAAATPQLRNMATLGGNLAQRTRCWYFRSIDHKCLRKDGDRCFARHGENQYHSIMRNGSCVSVHSSSVATALMAFGARVEIVDKNGEKKEVEMDKFFIEPLQNIRNETILKESELITAVIVPPVKSKVKSIYVKGSTKSSHDWPIADVALVAEISGSKCKNPVVVLGAAAPVPLKSTEAAAALEGMELNEANAKAAAEAAMAQATPLEKNGYKVDLFKAIVKRAVLQIV